VIFFISRYCTLCQMILALLESMYVPASIVRCVVTRNNVMNPFTRLPGQLQDHALNTVHADGSRDSKCRNVFVLSYMGHLWTQLFSLQCDIPT